MSNPAPAPDDHADVVAQRDEALAEHRQLRMESAAVRLGPAAGADPARLLDSTTFADEFADLVRSPSDADVTAAIERTVAAQPSVRPVPSTPPGRPPRAAAGQGSAETSARTAADQRASEGGIAREMRRAADRKNGRHR